MTHWHDRVKITIIVLFTDCLRASEWNENKAQSIPQLASLKMTLNSAMAKVKVT